ncbi:hypothetical protein [Bacillus sp. JJ722]|uniref:hypothetical protein n=1 Tax=Bacillus sp. JJ722 TaxID=3122973 RepID=UPI002FFE8F20
MKYDDDRWRSFYLGKVAPIRGEFYKILEWTDISVKSTNIKVEMTGKPIYPISPKEARSRYIQERKNKLEFEVL